MRGDEISYGANVIFLRYGQYFSNLLGVSSTAPLLKYGPIILAFVLVMVGGIIGIAHRESLTSSSARNLAAFRMGASIYVGTFLLGNNWDYRLAFLILVMPQLLLWSRLTGHARFRFIATTVLILVFISCWNFVIWFAPSLANVKELLFVIDEIANWMLVAGLGYLLSVSMPDWMKEQFLFLLPKQNPIQVG